MKKKLLLVSLLSLALIFMFAFAGCGGGQTDDASGEPEEEATEETTEVVVDGSAYGYAGDDPIECAVYKYLAEEVAAQYPDADVTIPLVTLINVNATNPDDITVAGDYYVFNYNIDGDTLKTDSGGSHPGKLHLAENGGAYDVIGFDAVADGEEFESSAKEIFGESYDDFAAAYSDDEMHDTLRLYTVSGYVQMNGLEVTKYQDEGWDPVDLVLE